MWLKSKFQMLLKLLLIINCFVWSVHSFADQKASSLNDEQFQLYLKVGGVLRCPTCTGLSIIESKEGLSLQIKDLLIEQVKQGMTEQQILDFFQARYGQWIFREPPKKGVHLIAWVGPVAVVVIGGFLIWALVWRKRQTFTNHGVRSTTEILAEMEQKLEQLKAKGV